MSIRTLAARGLSFAHLAGLSARGSRAEGDEPEDEDKKDARRAEDDEPDEKDDDKRDAKGSRADDDELADDESDEKDEKDDKAKGKRAKAAEDEEDEKDERADDDDDDDEEMRGKSAIAKARRREQARCAAIFASPAAARNPVLAANLAFKGRMPRSEAIAMLESTPAPASAAHVQRSAKNPNLGADGGTKPSRQQALAARWDENLKAANPSRR